MVKLVDLAPVTVPVKIERDGKPVALDVGGVSIGAVASILMRFPEVQTMIDGEGVSLKSLSRLADPALAAIIAAACGSAGDEKAERMAAGLPAHEQLAILEAAIPLTMPKGLGPFVEKLVSLISEIGADKVLQTGANQAA